MSMRHTAAWCWILAAPLFLAANVVAAVPWQFSWADSTISDLGRTSASWHGLMNATLLLTAVLLTVGAVSLLRGRLARVLLLLTSLGYALAGLYPVDVNENAHFVGGLLILLSGNASMVFAAYALRDELRPWLWLRDWTLILAAIAIMGTVLFFARQGMGIGVGGMQRIAVFPLLVWATVVGLQTKVGSSAGSGVARALGRPSTARRSLPLRSHEMPNAHTEMTSPT